MPGRLVRPSWIQPPAGRTVAGTTVITRPVRRAGHPVPGSTAMHRIPSRRARRRQGIPAPLTPIAMALSHDERAVPPNLSRQLPRIGTSCMHTPKTLRLKQTGFPFWKSAHSCGAEDPLVQEVEVPSAVHARHRPDDCPRHGTRLRPGARRLERRGIDHLCRSLTPSSPERTCSLFPRRQVIARRCAP